MMYLNSISTSNECVLSAAGDNRLECYSSDCVNETSLIAKSMSWNYSDEVDDARRGGKDNIWKRDNGEIVDREESHATVKIAGINEISERKDSAGIGGNEGITEREEQERTADEKDNKTITDNIDNARSSKKANEYRQNREDHVTGSKTEAGHVATFRAENPINEIPQSSSEGRRHRKHPCVRAKEDSNLRRTVELVAAQSSKPRAGLTPHQSERPHDVGKATLTRCILATSRFIWLPMCQPNRGCRHSEVMDDSLVAAAECVRWHLRRNALCDHMVMPMTQETRERIQRDVADRKTSVTRKVSQYLKAAFNTSNYDVDLI